MEPVFDADERRAILAAARRAVNDAAAGRAPYRAPAAGPFARRAGAFVSLHRRGELRGCIGHVDASHSLAEVISRCAAAAAVDDPRFPPLTPADVTDIDIEVSVLGGLSRVGDVGEIQVGRHGLLVELGGRQGLLLPQVATEHGWDRETFLARTCTKAGLPADAWRAGATIYRFEADVFGEPV